MTTWTKCPVLSSVENNLVLGLSHMNIPGRTSWMDAKREPGLTGLPFGRIWRLYRVLPSARACALQLGLSQTRVY